MVSVCPHPLEEPPQQGQGVFAVVLLHDVREAQQGELLPAAPHRLAVDQGATAQGCQEETRVPEHQLEDGVTGHPRVGPDQVVGLLQLSVQVLEEGEWTHTHLMLLMVPHRRNARGCT